MSATFQLNAAVWHCTTVTLRFTDACDVYFRMGAISAHLSRVPVSAMSRVFLGVCLLPRESSKTAILYIRSPFRAAFSTRNIDICAS
jgi:hypothetical protein